MVLKTREEFDDFFNDLNFNSESFSLSYSGSKIKIEWDEETYTYYANELKLKKGLHFIKKVKDYIDSTGMSFYGDPKIQYNGKNLNLKNSVWYSKDIWEIDLNRAYWLLAFKHGFISMEIYKEGLLVDKKIRLIALGTLAKNETLFTYKDGGLIDIKQIYNEHTRGIFFKLAHDVDLVMRDLKRSLNKNSDFLFYWVDAIFFRGSHNIEIIKKKIYASSLDFKLVEIKKLIRKKDNIEVVHIKKGKKKLRKFNFKKQIDTKGLF